jgi:hypothetical protein
MENTMNVEHDEIHRAICRRLRNAFEGKDQDRIERELASLTKLNDAIMALENVITTIEELRATTSRQSKDFPAELALRGLDYDN